MTYKIRLVISSLWALLAGCTTSPTFVAQPDQPIAVPITVPLTLEPVNWQVVTIDQMKAMLTKLKSPTILIVLDEQNFKALSLNLIDIQRYIKEQKAVVLMLTNIIQTRAGGVPVKP